ncbi:hypothetical protein ACX80E_16395 [Arthrobacter sp. TMN-49]
MATSPKIPGLGAFMDKNPGTPKPETPGSVTAAARLLALCAVVQVVASIFGLIYASSPERLSTIQEQIDAMSGEVPSLELLRNMGILTVIMAGVVTAGAYLFISYFLLRGRSWARTLGAVLVVLTLIQLVGISFPEGLTTVAQLLVGGVAVGLCYLPASNKYFADVKAARS